MKAPKSKANEKRSNCLGSNWASKCKKKGEEHNERKQRTRESKSKAKKNAESRFSLRLSALPK
jgi:hypothetical protein